MPAYAELELLSEGSKFELRAHEVNRQDPSKQDYAWPKLGWTTDGEAIDWNVFIPEYMKAAGVEGSPKAFVKVSFNHGISVQKDPDRESSDPSIKEFKASFRKALGAGDGAMLAVLKDENIDLFEELKADHITKLEQKANLLG